MVLDNFSRLLRELGTTREHKSDERVKEYVENEARDLKGEAFTVFMNQVYEKLKELTDRCACYQKERCRSQYWC